MLTGIAAAGAAGLIGALGSYYTNKANIKANQKRFAQEVELANTAHQREVFDLKAAGLNPILSAGGAGASVPSTAPYEQSSPTEGIGGIAAALNSASSADLNTANVDKLQSDISKSQFLSGFYSTPLGQEILQQQAIKEAAPTNAVQAAGMAALQMPDFVRKNLDDMAKPISTTTSNQMSQSWRDVYKSPRMQHALGVRRSATTSKRKHN